MDENETVETDEHKLARELGEIAVGLFLKYDSVVASESWGKWTTDERNLFRAGMDSLSKITTALRSAFDDPIWNGRIVGVAPVRAKSTRAAEVQTSTDKLAKLLSK
jgi:hypothetical protein